MEQNWYLVLYEDNGTKSERLRADSYQDAADRINTGLGCVNAVVAVFDVTNNEPKFALAHGEQGLVVEVG